jgi:hypothetical protein
MPTYAEPSPPSNKQLHAFRCNPAIRFGVPKIQISGCDKADTRQILLGAMRGLRLSSSKSSVAYTSDYFSRLPFADPNVVDVASYIMGGL